MIVCIQEKNDELLMRPTCVIKITQDPNIGWQRNEKVGEEMKERDN